MSLIHSRAFMLSVMILATAAGCSHLARERQLASTSSLTENIYINETELPTLQFVHSAAKSIDVEIYEMGAVGFRAELRRALAAGIRVRVIKDGDPNGESSCRYFEPASSQDDPDCTDQKKLVTEVRKAGGMFIPFNKPQLCGQPGKNCFEHGKLIIIDGTAALMSTGNFSPENFCGPEDETPFCTRDYSYITRDPSLVGVLVKIFEHDLESIAYDLKSLLTPPVRAKLTVSPFSLDPLVAFIRSARKSVEIQNQYLKEPTINRALAEKAKTGVKVSVTVSSPCAFNRPNSAMADNWRKIFADFDAAGVETHIFPSKIHILGHLGYMHAKTIVIDGQRAWMGSVNGSTTATSMNREYGIFFDEPSQVRRLLDQMHRDQDDPNGETWQESLNCKKDPRIAVPTVSR